ncbi:MAG: STAS domain-containing protein [Rhodocyclaceae bacterium]|nr:STAS domain-containing protein [Rhodocyclaceae bacterium]MBK9623851.1 STAS domain-containing protein [Rhodocyclaceae bacterium]MBL0075452.1 STAS domain-containing protein [Rhodocyclaceae bacterium]MBP6110221.1 STAS domain-containing protein [Rhodocyclaceae bacterium]MBP6279446.1 STAS domain-containing protein [Rhodocyclaceae bacterium]
MIQLDGAQARVSGSMTIAAASELLVAGREAIAASAGGAATGGVAQTFDLSAVTEVDSAGLAVMFAWLREAKSRNVELTFCNLPKSLNSLAAVYDVAALLPQN